MTQDQAPQPYADLRGTPDAARRAVPGEFLLQPAPLAAAAVIAFNDLYLKRYGPGVVSGKLSDVGLCFVFPLFVAALADWAIWLAIDLPRARPFAPSSRAHLASVTLAVAYFCAIKLSADAARLHVLWLSALAPGRHFAAIADPTDLLCLPLSLAAAMVLASHRRKVARSISRP